MTERKSSISEFYKERLRKDLSKEATFSKAFYKALKPLNDEDKLLLLMSCFEWVFEDTETTLKNENLTNVFNFFKLANPPAINQNR